MKKTNTHTYPQEYTISHLFFPSTESIQEEEIKRIRTSLSKAPLAFRVFLSRKELKIWKKSLAWHGVSLDKDKRVYFWHDNRIGDKSIDAR